MTDNLTGLVWLKNANCAVFFDGDTIGHNYRGWSSALTAANSLASGYCGLTDSSSEGDWRLPNVRELQSLVHYGVFFEGPAVPNTAGTGQWTEGDPFTGVQPDLYWSSTVKPAVEPGEWDALVVDLNDGLVFIGYTYYYVWPVRGGQ